ncbi:MAG: LemA family protein [Synergistaceae bacterium]|jgi:LemA protein|nr:LemA family protein [Synergistaceae bacterium]
MSAISVVVIIAVILILILLWGISVYNKLVRLSNLKDEAWSGVDVPLKRRFDLTPNLVETVKSCAAHDSKTLQEVVDARAAISAATTQNARIDAENSLTDTLRSLFAAAESCPKLKASENFAYLRNELSSLENELQMARRYYNGTVRDFNGEIQMFPAVLISKRLGYQAAAFFGSDGEPREPVKGEF